jgi:hypothetical protein
LDNAGDKMFFDVVLVFRNLPDRANRSWLWSLLKPGFQHVECWQYHAAWALWTRLEPCFEGIVLDLQPHAPDEQSWVEGCDSTFLRVQRETPKDKMHTPFAFGPLTCVEIAKAAIGLHAPLVRTPYQLFKALRHGR